MDNLLAGDVAVITGPDGEPMDVDFVKLHSRVGGDVEDSLIDFWIRAARRHVENILWRALITQTLELTLHAWPRRNEIQLPRPPLVSVTSVKTTDSAGVEATWPATKYQVITQGSPGRIVPAYGESWPSTTLRAANGIAVRYVAGYGDADDVPEQYKQAMLLLIGHWYENREAVVVGAGLAATPLPMGFDSLLIDSVR
jgi:uncharacterized phiE125 gp8 family phage protein